MSGLDIYDTADKQLVWRGSATKTIDDKANPQKRQDTINKATATLLKNYPATGEEVVPGMAPVQVPSVNSAVGDASYE